jgi:rubredoxin
VVCDFVYDEAEGIPDEGIVPSTRWADVLDCWACRDCGAPQSGFEMVEA